MTPKIRNTLVLGLFWGVLFVAAWGILGLKQTRELERWKNREAALDAELARSETAAANLGELTGQERTRAQEEVLSALDTRSSQPLFEYLRTLLQGDARTLRLHFEELQGGTEGVHRYQRYALKGEGETKAAYRLLWELESGERMIQVESVRLQDVPVERSSFGKAGVSFDIVVRAYLLDDGRPVFSPVAARTTSVPDAIDHDPFAPLIAAQLPANTRDLLEVDRSALRALTAEIAYFRDQKGRLVTLKQGDPVYLGYLTRIYPDQNRVEFTLDRGGTVERVSLRLEMQR